MWSLWLRRRLARPRQYLAAKWSGSHMFSDSVAVHAVNILDPSS
jgi:hypothetical protein